MSIPPSSSTSQQFTYAASATSATATATAANGTYFPTPFHLQQSDPYPKPYVTPPPTVMAPVYPPAPIGPVYSLPQYQQVSNCIYICCIWDFFLLMLVKVLWYRVIWLWLWNCYLFCVKFVVVYFEVGFIGFRGNWVILGFNWVFCGNVKIEMWICDYKIDYILIGSELILLEKRKIEMIIYLFNLGCYIHGLILVWCFLLF